MTSLLLERMDTNAIWALWDDREAIKIPGTEYTLRGFSIVALRTNFYIKELGIMPEWWILQPVISRTYLYNTYTY